MSALSGVGLVDLAILHAAEQLGARPRQPYRKCASVVDAVDSELGLAPGYLYDLLVDLSRPWTLPVRLLDFHGNSGDRDFEPAASRYTECRLCEAGQVVLAAERGEIAPIPVGLINGNTHREGSRPPLQPLRAIFALRSLLNDPAVTDVELLDLVGPPDFLDGCTVSGNLDAYTVGEATALRLQGTVTVDAGEVIIRSVPFNSSPRRVMDTISRRATTRSWHNKFPALDGAARPPIAGLDNLSDAYRTRLVCRPDKHVDPDELRAIVANLGGVVTEVAVHLPAPLPQLLRSWVTTHRTPQTGAALNTLEAAFNADRAPGPPH